jgi:hypothetical protein
VRSPGPETASVTLSGKLYRFIDAMGHIMQITRWDRTLRVVR